MYYEVKGDIELYFFDMLELLQCQNLLKVETVGKQYRDSVHVRTFTMMFQCGCVKGKYHCFVHSRILVFPHLKAIPLCMALMV